MSDEQGLTIELSTDPIAPGTWILIDSCRACLGVFTTPPNAFKAITDRWHSATITIHHSVIGGDVPQIWKLSVQIADATFEWVLMQYQPDMLYLAHHGYDQK